MAAESGRGRAGGRREATRGPGGTRAPPGGRAGGLRDGGARGAPRSGGAPLPFALPRRDASGPALPLPAAPLPPAPRRRLRPPPPRGGQRGPRVTEPAANGRRGRGGAGLSPGAREPGPGWVGRSAPRVGLELLHGAGQGWKLEDRFQPRSFTSGAGALLAVNLPHTLAAFSVCGKSVCPAFNAAPLCLDPARWEVEKLS